MQHSKTYDIEYPGVTSGTQETPILTETMTLPELVVKVGGTFETSRLVRPTKLEYDYVTVARD
jgi:hypothetical protein